VFVALPLAVPNITGWDALPITMSAESYRKKSGSKRKQMRDRLFWRDPFFRAMVGYDMGMPGFGVYQDLVWEGLGGMGFGGMR